METKEKTIRSYCESRGITMEQFSNMVGISASQLYKIQRDRSANMTIENIVKIWNGTKSMFGEGLSCWEYLDIPEFINK